jgi:hypothetical protein
MDQEEVNLDEDNAIKAKIVEFSYEGLLRI